VKSGSEIAFSVSDIKKMYKVVYFSLLYL